MTTWTTDALNLINGVLRVIDGAILVLAASLALGAVYWLTVALLDGAHRRETARRSR